jgi:CheY-specific phosphatase CheX
MNYDYRMLRGIMAKEIKTGKPWYKSKTIWVNVLAIVAGLAAWAQGEIATGATLTVGGAINAVLRIVTKEQLVK